MNLENVCLSSLSPSNEANSVITLYNDDSNNAYRNTGFGLNNFFNNRYPSACAINQGTCTIMAQGCLTEYEGNKIKWDASSRQYVQFTNEEGGYTERVCVRCSNGL